jgi:hypothetical protein
MSQPARWNGALGHSPSPARLGGVIRFGFLNIGRINRRSNVWRRTVSANRPVLMLVAPLGFLGVKEVNDFHVPVVQNLLMR